MLPHALKSPAEKCCDRLAPCCALQILVMSCEAWASVEVCVKDIDVVRGLAQENQRLKKSLHDSEASVQTLRTQNLELAGRPKSALRMSPYQRGHHSK
eukprot:s1914_g4.t1